MSNLENTVLLLGRPTTDIEIKVAGERKIARFTLAVKSGFGEKAKTNFIPCVAWNKTAELLSSYVKKGHEVMVGGSLQSGSYEKDGVKHFTLEVLVNDMKFLSRKEQNDNNQNSVTSDQIREALEVIEADDLFKL